MSVDTATPETKTAKAAKTVEPQLPAMPADTAGDTAKPETSGRSKAAWSGVVQNGSEPTRSITRTASGTTDVITFAVYVPQYDRMINVEMSAADAGKHVDNLTAVLDD